MASQMHQDDFGAKILMTITDNGSVVDISSAINQEIRMVKPNDDTIDRPAVFETDGTDGKMYYIIQAGDFNQAGYYRVQGKVTLPTGSYKTDIHKFKVHCNI